MAITTGMRMSDNSWMTAISMMRKMPITDQAPTTFSASRPSGCWLRASSRRGAEAGTSSGSALVAGMLPAVAPAFAPVLTKLPVFSGLAFSFIERSPNKVTNVRKMWRFRGGRNFCRPFLL